MIRDHKDIHSCLFCHAKYERFRRQTPPGFIPSCDGCGQDFLARDSGDWLVYERIA
jgi:hypothetical protein